jgi:[acyl-carrier-protein] S-malonyltransferase
MGFDLYKRSPAARAVYDIADTVLGYKISRVCFEGPEEKLRETEFTQPAIFTTSLACLAAAIETGKIAGRPAFMAGHSLGEYSALVAAGALTLQDGLALLAERARLMGEVGRETKGTMAAILGLDEASVRELCRDADVDVCNLNLATQTVIGGTHEGVERAMALAKERGAARAQMLNVSGAFHSRLMAPAAADLRLAIDKTTIVAPAVPVVANASAEPLASPAQISEELGVQVATAVRWHDSVTLMAARGVSTYVEFGPGKVLTGMVRRIVEGATLMNVGNAADAGIEQG